MGIKVQWASDMRGVVMMEFAPRWMGVDLVDAASQVRELTDAYGKPCSVICNLQATLVAPDSLLPTVRNILNGKLPEQVTRVIVVAESPLWRKLYQVIFSLYQNQMPFEVIFVKNMIEARTFVNPPAVC